LTPQFEESIMLTVNDLMTAVPSSVTPATSLRTIIGIMKAGGYRQIPVLQNGKLVGIITDRDIRLVMNSPIVLHDRSMDTDLLNQVTVESCMTPNPVTVAPNTPAYQAAEMLSMYKFGALPVVDEDTLVGIITTTDFLVYFTRSHGDHLEEDE
jgi:acetoin utilization protein AcuB